MSQYNCYASYKVCAIRAARLGADCKVVPGMTGGFASSGIMTFGATSEKETGQEYEIKNGCGDIAHYFRDCDRVKNLNLTMEFTGFDFEALEILTGGQLALDNAETPKVVGISDPGINNACGYGSYLEIWTKSIVGTNNCNVASGTGFGWFRVVFPRAILSFDDTTYQNDVETVKLSGYGFANPAITDVGPFNDYPLSTPLDPHAPRHIFGDPDGPPTLGCGYVTVPAPASS